MVLDTSNPTSIIPGTSYRYNHMKKKRKKKETWRKIVMNRTYSNALTSNPSSRNGSVVENISPLLP